MVAAPFIYGHRGASADAPENTIEAFTLARHQGADGVELDVRRTRDGTLAIHHDAALPDGRLLVHLARDELPSSVPVLEAALDACAGLVVNIEIKNTPIDPDFDPERSLAGRVVALLAERAGAGMVDRPLISSFDPRTVDAVRAIDPSVPTALLTFLDPDATRGLALAVERGHGAIHPWDGSVDADLVEAAHAAGIAVNVWTVDAPDRILALAELGVDGICTNVPGVARTLLG